MISVAGFALAIDHRELTPAEQALVESLPRSSATAADFTIQLRGRPDGFHSGASQADPAEVTSEPPLVRLTHPRFSATVDLHQSTALLERNGDVAYPLLVLLRLVASSLITTSGGLPLHSSAVLFGSECLLFFGRSGAGKSTIAGRLERPVLSDELVYVRNRRASATGFWGSLPPEKQAVIDGAFEVRAAISLEKGGPLALTRMTPSEALPELLAVTLVPRATSLWHHALPAVVSFASAVPVYRLRWSLSDSPDDALIREMGLGPSRR